MYNVSWALVYKVNIDDETIFQVLNEINGVAPTSWFIARNVGKDRKETFAYIVNNAPEYIQLIPLKGNKKNGLIDKGNIITLNKSTDIEKCILIMTDYCKIKLQSKDGTKFLLIAHIVGSTKHQRKSIKALRKEYKKSSRPSQTFWNVFLVVVTVLTVIVSYNIGREIGENMRISQQQEQSQEDEETVKEVEQQFNKNIEIINSPEYKDVLSIKVQPYESKAVITGETKTVEVNSFRFKVSANSELHKFDSGNYGYIDNSNNKIISAGYVLTRDTTKEVTDLQNSTYKHIEGGTFEKMGYSINSWYENQKSTYSIDYFNADIQNFNLYEKMLFNLAMNSRMRDATEQSLLLAVYEKEFDSYYMIVKKIQHSDMAEELVYGYEIDIYFKDDLNTLESYAITNMGYTEEECFAIINSMELIEE